MFKTDLLYCRSVLSVQCVHLYVADQKGRSTISFYQLYFFVPKYCLIAVLLMLFLLALAVMCKLNCYTIFAVSFFLT